MIRVLFLLLVALSFTVLAQTEEKPKAEKFDEFEAATNGYVKMRMDSFFTALSNNPIAQGYLINYGTDREIAMRERQLRNSIAFRKYDAARITFVRGGFWKNIKSELWIVPPGADNPKPDSDAQKFDEFEAVPDGEFRARIDSLYESLRNNPNSRGYILNYGPAKVVARREKRIKQFISNKKLNLSQVNFINGGPDLVGRTEFWLLPADEKKDAKTRIWIVPAGAKPPIQ